MTNSHPYNQLPKNLLITATLKVEKRPNLQDRLTIVVAGAQTREFDEIENELGVLTDDLDMANLVVGFSATSKQKHLTKLGSPNAERGFLQLRDNVTITPFLEDGSVTPKGIEDFLHAFNTIAQRGHFQADKVEGFRKKISTLEPEEPSHKLSQASGSLISRFFRACCPCFS